MTKHMFGLEYVKEDGSEDFDQMVWNQQIEVRMGLNGKGDATVALQHTDYMGNRYWQLTFKDATGRELTVQRVSSSALSALVKDAAEELAKPLLSFKIILTRE